MDDMIVGWSVAERMMYAGLDGEQYEGCKQIAKKDLQTLQVQNSTRIQIARKKRMTELQQLKQIWQTTLR